MIWILKLKLRFYIHNLVLLMMKIEEWGGEEGDIVCNEFG